MFSHWCCRRYAGGGAAAASFFVNGRRCDGGKVTAATMVKTGFNGVGDRGVRWQRQHPTAFDSDAGGLRRGDGKVKMAFGTSGGGW
jgi:hypothetical protein